MTVAERTREAVAERPFLRAALRAGVVNYAAAAATLSVDGDDDAVATALRRHAEELPPLDPTARDARVTMHGGVGLVDGDDGEGSAEASEPGATDGDALLVVGGVAVRPDAGSATAVSATGEVDPAALAAVLGRLRTAGVAVRAAGVGGDALTVVVDRRDGATAVRLTEAALEGVR